MADYFQPELTLPEDAGAWLKEAYDAANVILEYGSGGSTVMASRMANKTVFAVESDVDWIKNLRGWLDLNPGNSDVTLHHGNIGPTKEWGAPKADSQWRRFANYALSVWDREDFVHPDVVLVDGRFRKACALATIFRATKPVTLYFDDYVDRERYHEIESFVPCVALVGRMARFDITPQAVDPKRLLDIIRIFGQQA